MKEKLAILLAAVFILVTCGTTQAHTYNDHLPPETIVLKSLNNSYAKWKEISRYVTEKEGMIECIPPDQQIANWSELICIQYFDKSSIKNQASTSVHDIVELFRKSTLAAYPGNKVTWNLIEKNKSDVIYEWILHKPFKNGFLAVFRDTDPGIFDPEFYVFACYGIANFYRTFMLFCCI